MNFYLQTRRITGRARSLEEGIEVLAGSQAIATTATIRTPGYVSRRDALIADGTLVPDPSGGGRLRFTRAVRFKSLSEAASICLGHSANGRASWRPTTEGQDDRKWRNEACELMRALLIDAPPAWKDALTSLADGLARDTVPNILAARMPRKRPPVKQDPVQTRKAHRRPGETADAPGAGKARQSCRT